LYKKVLGIIPARGGSKGVKRKNIRSVAGKPLIYWSIAAAQKATSLTTYYISTEDKEISDIASLYGAACLSRPHNLAGDQTPMTPVLQHLCVEAEKLHGRFDYILLMQPTAPMRTAKHIDGAIDLMSKHVDCDSLVSVYQVEDCHPSRMYTCKKGFLSKFYEEPVGSLRQDLKPVYHRNGAIYLCKRELLMEENKLVCESPLAFIMNKNDSVNIDDEQDLRVADFLMSELAFNHKPVAEGS
jgi:CMP-N,N'-diacetyllegionaminic acid synthase